MPTFSKKFTTILIIIFFLFGALRPAAPAYAQLAVTDLAATSLFSGKWLEENFMSSALDALMTGAKVMLVNGFRYFTQKLAYDAAVYITAGGSGEKPLLANKSFGDYMKDTAMESVGSSIDALGAKFGVDFCTPSQGPLLQAQIQLGLSVDLAVDTGKPPPPPKCELNKMLDDFEGYFEQFDSPAKALDQVGLVFSPGGNDLGTVLKAHQTIIAEKSIQENQAEKERLEGQGFLPQKSKAGQFITTPGSFVARESGMLSAEKMQDAQRGEFESMSATESIGYILANSASIFLNTMAQQGLNKLMNEGFISLSDVFGLHDSDALSSETASVSYGGVAGAQLAYASLLTPRISGGETFNLAAELVSCPQTGRSINNCAMDQAMMSAVNASQQGQNITIKVALEKEWLHGNWRLLPPDHEQNQSYSCYSSAYCYSNIVKLRRGRIMPLGFELAAQNSPKDNPWTLQKVVSNFNNCNASGVADGEHPFCHLIDPNWFIKSPPTRCNARGPGQMLLGSGGNLRQDYCADVQDCIATDDQGNCIGVWGYCLNEKNTWALNADSCPAQFASCTAYTARTGGQNAYLSTTIDHDICSASNVGCRGYFTSPAINSQNNTITWVDKDATDGKPTGAIELFANKITNLQNLPTYKQAPRIFFNKDVSQCAEADAGCTKVVRLDSSDAYIKLAPDTLKLTADGVSCYDNDGTKPGVQLPFSIEDAKKLASQPHCSKYAAVCAEEELGCKAFTPKDGGTEITGIANAEDFCPKECVGYNAYKQEATEFENLKFPEYLIPATASQCSLNDVGCDEFTNMDKPSAGGENLEYYTFVRHCGKPVGTTPPPNFYTWEGSDTAGLQIKVFQLEVDPNANANGAPAYNTANAAMLAKFDAECNATTYKSGTASLDCREIYNSAGAVSYRLLSKTVTISADCHPLRRTINTKKIQNEQDCKTYGGTWNSTLSSCSSSEEKDCNTFGGTWNSTAGSCTYNAIPSESKSCAAQSKGCRLYQGSGDATQTIFSHTFESIQNIKQDYGYFVSANNEDPPVLSTESLIPSGHSMYIEGGKGAQTGNYVFESGATYYLKFWAKGDGNAGATVMLAQQENLEFAINALNIPVDNKLSSVWRYYSFGPLKMPEKITAEKTGLLIKVSDSSSGMFIDNLELTKGDFFALIKDSSKIPASCDAILGDNIPGAALGCSLYKESEGGSQSKEVALKSFSNLCRPEAIGCENVRDTRNTVALEEAHFNTSEADTLGIKNTDTSDDIIIGADRELRVVLNKSASCPAAVAGCQMMGLKRLTGTDASATSEIVPVHLINNPEKYSNILCQAQADGCESFVSKQGINYFKDPQVTTKVCDYREGLDIGGTKYSGWFKTGSNPVVACNPSYLKTGNEYGINKSADADYIGYAGSCATEHDQCFELVDPTDINIKGTPRSYFIKDNDKLDRASCKGNVSRQEGCALFDDTRNPIKNYSAVAAYAASETQGGKAVAASNYSLTDAYKNLTVQFVGSDVDCATSTSNYEISKLCQQKAGASNTLLKVRRDRACGLWLSCNSYIKVENAPAGKQLQCSGLGVCAGYQINAESGISQCTKWITPEKAPMYGKVFNDANYSSRSVKFTDPEFSGMTVANVFSPVQYEIISYEKNTAGSLKQNTMLVATVSDEYLKKINSNQLCNGKNDKSACGVDSKGKCLQGKCSYAYSGTPINFTTEEDFIAPSCRVWPDQTAPFSSSVVSSWQGIAPVSFNRPEYSKANVCWDGSKVGYGFKSNECACRYKKITYASQTNTLFVDVNASIPAGICFGGYATNGVSKTGAPCGLLETKENGEKIYESCWDERPEVRTPEEDKKLLSSIDFTERQNILEKLPAQPGTCNPRDATQTQYTGLQGYCIDYDLRTGVEDSQSRFACNTWYPIDIGLGISDIYNQSNEAGYVPPTDSGKYWCVQSAGNMSTVASGSYNFGNETKPAYTYNAVSFNSSVSLSTTVPGTPTEYKEGVRISKDWPLFDGFTNTRNGKPNVMAEELDGILINPDNNISFGKPVFIGADEYVRCYGDADKIFRDQITYKQICEMYTSVVKGKGMIFVNTDSASLILTFRDTRNTDFEDWLVLWGNDETRDVGDCNQDFQKSLNSFGYSKNVFEGVFLTGDGNPFYDADKNGKNEKDTGWDHAVWTNFNSFSGFCDIIGIDKDCAAAGGFGHDKLLGGLQFRFEKNGNQPPSLKKLNNVLCKNKPDDDHWKADVKLLFREQCLYVAQGAEDTGDTTYPMTQHLWKKQGLTLIGGQSYYSMNNENYLSDDPFRLELLAWGQTPAFLDYNERTGPYGSIYKADLKNTNTKKIPVYTYAQTINDHITEDLKTDANKYQLNVETMLMSAAASFGCPGGFCGEFQYNKELRINKITDNEQNFKENIKEKFLRLFAKPIQFFKWSYEEGKFKPDSTHKIFDFDNRKVSGVPPMVAAVDRNNAVVALKAFTVNEKYKSDDIVFGVESINAYAKFAAWADTDQMPLKRIMVDWSDGTKAGGSKGLYKNRKAYCSSETEPIGYCTGAGTLPNLTCATSEDCSKVSAGSCITEKVLVFGNDPAACTVGSFEYNHVYTYDPLCGMSNPNDVETDITSTAYPKHIIATSELFDNEKYKKLKNLGVQIGDNFCIFKPKVQVLDNWEWCNGKCGTLGRGGIEGCLNKEDDSQIGLQCNPDNPIGKAFTSFAGEVIIVEGDD